MPKTVTLIVTQEEAQVLAGAMDYLACSNAQDGNRKDAKKYFAFKDKIVSQCAQQYPNTADWEHI